MTELEEYQILRTMKQLCLTLREYAVQASEEPCDQKRALIDKKAQPLFREYNVLAAIYDRRNETTIGIESVQPRLNV